MLIKVPATAAGVPAIEELTARGVNINVTLLFSLRRYEEVIEAYLRGLERRADRGKDLGGLASVASFFVSRVDSNADALLSGDSPSRGRITIANAHRAYGRYLERFAGPRWERLEALGAKPQRPLWASTGTKNPAYSDVLYVEPLIAPGVINTMPEATLRAFADHGSVGQALDTDLSEAERIVSAADDAGLDLDAITAELALQVPAVLPLFSPRERSASAVTPRSESAARYARPSYPHIIEASCRLPFEKMPSEPAPGSCVLAPRAGTGETHDYQGVGSRPDRIRTCAGRCSRSPAAWRTSARCSEPNARPSVRRSLTGSRASVEGANTPP